MNKRLISIVLFFSVLALPVLACGGSFSTAKISEAYLTNDPSSSTQTTTFGPNDTFYVVAKLANAPDDTKVKAVWYVVEAEGADPNQLLDQAELTGSDQTMTFKLTNNQAWPAGKYKVELYLNDKLDRTLELTVQ